MEYLKVEKVPLAPGVEESNEYPEVGDTVVVHYEGFLENGEDEEKVKFDSSRDRNKHFVTKIGVGKVIKGWDVGILQLSKGETAIFIVKPEWAYGAKGFPPIIPPNSTLKFVVELVDIQRARVA